MPDEKRPSYSIYIVLIGIGIIVVGAYFAYQYFYTATPVSKYSETNPVSNVLRQNFSDFGLAGTYVKQFDFKNAKAAYERTLPLAQDAYQEAQVRFNIALMDSYLGNHADAIAAFKEIAADERYYPMIRAYAVQEIGAMRTTYPLIKDIPTKTFAGQPFASFKDANNEPLAYAKLFEYAVSIYSLSLSHASAAYWYAKELESLQSTTTPTAQAYIVSISQHLESAQTDLKRLQANLNESSYVALFFLREAITTDLMTKLGIESYSSAAAEALYKKALDASRVAGFKQGNFFAYAYADFLAVTYGTARSSDIRTILAVFTESNATNIAPALRTLFASAATSTSLQSKKSEIVRLGRLAPDFKTYLISLGWNESDF